jgi:hypothetical protein
MGYRGIVDPKGELFAYIDGTTVLTLEGEPTGRLEGEFIVDLAGNPMWRIVGDGVYSFKGAEPIGYIGSATPPDF